MNSNLKTYALQSEDEIRKRYRQLLSSKYGEGNYDENATWHDQKGKTVGNWSGLQENVALENYNRYLQDLKNNQQLNTTAQDLQTSDQQAKASVGINNEIMQKYLGNQLRAGGINSGGIAESTQAGMANNYINNVANINQQTRDKSQQYMDYYRQAFSDREQATNEATSGMKNAYLSNYGTELENKFQEGTLSLEDYQKTINDLRSQGIDEYQLKGLEESYVAPLQEAQRNETNNKYGIKENTYIYNLDNERFTNLPSTRQKDIQSNKAKLIAIQSNPSQYEGKVIKLETAYQRQTFIVLDGKLYAINSKHNEDEAFKGLFNFSGIDMSKD